MKYLLSKEAENDLEEFWVYTYKNWSLKQADYYITLISKKFNFLTKNPDSGKDYSEVRKGYFRYRIESHYIFYKINKKRNAIEIIRILHQRMDIKTRLKE